MCIVERRTYQHSDGRREILERTRPCRRAVGSSLCRDVEVRNVEEANLIDRRPVDRVEDDALLVTEGFNGRRNVYREVDPRSGGRRSVRRSNTVNSPSPLASSSGRSSASYVERRPEAPSPPAAATFTPPLDPLRAEPSGRTVRIDGTAVYDRPPSLGFPRALENERRARFAEAEPTRRSSISSLTAEVDEVEPPVTRRRRPSISINTNRASPASSSPGTSSPGLSTLPKFGDLRHDSALPRYRSRQDSTEERQRRRRAEDDRQAQLERDRVSETDRLQETREQASRERHRAETAAALVGQREQETPQQSRIDAELQQMARERAAADARQQDEGIAQLAEDQLRRDADAARYRESQQRAPRQQLRRVTGEVSNVSPLSTRTPSYPVAIHQYPTVRRDSTLVEQGESIIAREQLRASRDAAEDSSPRRAQQASRRLSYALGDLAIDGPSSMQVEYDLEEEEVSERRDRRAGRKAQKEAERAERRRGFWK